MQSGNTFILSINGGSSSIKFALYRADELPEQLFYGKIERIAAEHTNYSFTNIVTGERQAIKLGSVDYSEAVNFLITQIEQQQEFAAVKAIGHRIVHGMKHTSPELITPELLHELKSICAYAPEHLPGEIKLIEAFQKRHPELTQVACFDTSFHTTMPAVAKRLAIPRKLSDKGIQRYGFHGISFSYLMFTLEQMAGSKAAKGKIIMAHLGNGASVAAVKDGKCVDTSMGFTPSAGLVMGTRTGDLDPGVAWYLMEVEKMNAATFNDVINHQSGLLGISETSADMRTLLATGKTDHRAAEAIELFCYQAKKWIGAYMAVLNGLDTLIFSGGIGENRHEIRERICNEFQFLGLEIDAAKNQKNEAIISTDTSKVCVRVMATNEELMIAKSVRTCLNFSS